MNELESKGNLKNSRRDFLSKTIPAGVLFCAACPKVFANHAGFIEGNPTADNSDSNKDSGMSYVEVFNFAFRDNFIPQMIALAEKLGREKFIDILKETASISISREHVMEHWNNDYDNIFWDDVLKNEVIEDTEDAREVKITKCLWAKIFKEENAADIGYASICYPDFAHAEATGKKLIRTKTLMQGDDFCNHRWILKK